MDMVPAEPLLDELPLEARAAQPARREADRVRCRMKAAVSRMFTATCSCRVHFMRNALAHADRSGRRVVSAFIATAFAQDDAEQARAQWRRVADQFRPSPQSSLT